VKQTSAALLVASVALATDMFVYGLAVPVLPIFARSLGASAATVGALFAVYAGALTLVTPLVGVWVDRRGPRAAMLFGMSGLAAATLLFAFAPGLYWLFLARALQGLSAGVSWTAGLALIAATHPVDQRGRAMGTALASASIGILFGPPLGGFLFERWGLRVPFLLAALVAALDALARLFLVREVARGQQQFALRPLLRDPRTWPVLRLTLLGAMLIAFLEPVLPLHLVETEAATPTSIGLIFGVAALVNSLSYPLAGRAAERSPPIRVATWGTRLGALALCGVGFLPTLWAVGIGVSLVAVAAGLILTPTTALVGEIAEAREPPAYGAAYALFNLAYAAGLAVAPLIAGAGTSAWGLPLTGALFGAALLAISAVPFRAARPS
jgi:DHA1 family solute carrier family 18 vesicular amine transporter 1/2